MKYIPRCNAVVSLCVQARVRFVWIVALLFFLLPGAGRAWASSALQYVVPQKMVLTNSFAPSINEAYSKIYVTNGIGQRFDMFSGSWGESYFGRYTITDPATGTYSIVTEHSWRASPTNLNVSTFTGIVASVYYRGGVAGSIVEPVTVTEVSTPWPPYCTVSLFPGGTLKLSGVIRDSKSLMVHMAGGTLDIEHCANLWLGADGSNLPPILAKGSTNIGLSVYGPAVTVEDCALSSCGVGSDNATFDNVGLDWAQASISGRNLTLLNSAWGGPVRITVSGQFQIQNNDFFGAPEFSVSSDGDGGIIGNTICAGGIQFVVAPGGKTVFSGNSLYGRGLAAFGGDLRLLKQMFMFEGAQSDLSLDGNYWGGFEGPSQCATREPPGWLHSYGGTILWNQGGQFFTNAAGLALGSGTPRATARTVGRTAPHVWAEGRRIGQNAMTSDGSLSRWGRPIMFCFDIRTDDPSLDLRDIPFTLQLKVWPNIGPSREIALHSLPNSVRTARRDYFGWGWDNERRTMNFTLDAADNYDNLKVEWTLYDDMSGCTQFGNPPGTNMVDYGEFYQTSYFSRPLRIGVVSVVIPDEPSNPGPAHAETTARILRENLQALWPLMENEVEVRVLGAIDYDGGVDSWLSGALSSAWGGFATPFVHRLSLSLEQYLATYNALAVSNGMATPLDYIIGVIPNTVLSAEGANTRLWQQAILVNADFPESALHELGHGLAGLWRSEQYQQKVGYHDGRLFDADGIVLRNMVGFNLSPSSVQGIWSGRFMSFPQDDSWLKSRKYHDFMGSRDPYWIDPATLSDVYGALYGLLLDSPWPPTPAAARAAPSVGITQTPGINRILFSGCLQWSAASSNYTLIPASFRASCVNSVGMGKVTPDGPVGAQVDAFTTSGLWLGAGPINFRWSNTYRGDLVQWSQTYDYGNSAQVGRYQGFGRTYLMRSGLVNELSATVIRCAPTNSDVVRLHWTCHGAVTGGTPMPLSQVVQFSADGGTSWRLLGAPATGNDMDLPASALSVGTGLVFRLLTSDGFVEVASRASVTPLSARQEGGVVISEPLSGDNGPTDCVWRLSSDISGAATQVQWSSSADGALGSGQLLEGVVLSSNTHVITCTAWYAGNQAASAQVSVVAGTAPDLRLRPGDLTFRPAGLDPSHGITAWQSAGTNTITLQVRNTGTAGYWKLRLYIRPPGLGESLLAEKDTALAAFETLGWDTLCAASSPGSYSLRAEAIPDTTSAYIPSNAPPTTDANWANNSLALTPSNVPPRALSQWVYVAAGTSTPVVLDGRDENSDPMTYAVTSLPTHGTLSGSPTNLTYVPAAGFLGQDSLRFTVSDGLAAGATGAVVIIVGDYDRPAAGEVPCLQVPAELTFARSNSVLIGLQTYPQATNVIAVDLPDGLAISLFPTSLVGSVLQSGDYSVTLAGQNQYGTGPSSVMLLHVLTPSGFMVWMDNYPELATMDRMPGADPDRDGVPNLIEYAMGGNPLIDDASTLKLRTSLFVSTYTGCTWARVHVPRSLTASNVVFSAYWSTNLMSSNWVKLDPYAGTGTYAPDLDNWNYPDNRYLNTWGARTPWTSGPRIFLRISVEDVSP